MSPRVVVVGAGLSGLTAARRLAAAGMSVSVLDKSRGVGGRLATRRFAGARFDHGAQFFTTRSAEFTELVAEAVTAGAVIEWCDGFGDPPDGYSRWRGVDGMTSLPKWMARDLDVSLGVTVTDLTEHRADAYLLTAPVPQSLAVLSFSGLLPPPSQAIELATMSYKPTIAVLATLDRSPSGLRSHGGAQFDDHPDLAFVTDNHAKGISDIPAVTIHLSNARSSELWNVDDERVLTAALGAARPVLGSAQPIDSQIQRWRYAGPHEVRTERFVAWGSDPIVALAGEAFGGPKVEGAFASGAAAGDAIIEALTGR